MCFIPSLQFNVNVAWWIWLIYTIICFNGANLKKSVLASVLVSLDYISVYHVYIYLWFNRHSYSHPKHGLWEVMYYVQTDSMTRVLYLCPSEKNITWVGIHTTVATWIFGISLGEIAISSNEMPQVFVQTATVSLWPIDKLSCLCDL